MPIDTSDAPSEDDEIVSEAKQRFAFCADWESYARDMYVEDQKFGHADADNQYQWPNNLLTDRLLQQRPTLTVNKVRIHCLQIINDAKQNKTSIVVHPTTNEATYEAAEIYEDVVRHIEYRSRAQDAYDKAVDNTVYGGYGGCRVISDYISPTSFDQELLIRGINDPLTVYIDPNAKEPDKSDMDYAFVYDDMARDRFNEKYPEFRDIVSVNTFGDYAPFAEGWVSDDHVRVAEYWRRKHDRKTLVSVINPESGERVSKMKDEVDPKVLKALKASPANDYRERETDIVTVECFKLAGDSVIEHYEWPGRYIPIAIMVGEETIIDGRMDRKGHVRYLKDPQRIYDIQTSAEVEFGALQTKTPWVGPAETFESYEEFYRQANVQNLAFLPFKAFDDDGRPLPAPQRPNPPQASEAYMKGMEIAQQEMMMASGQYQAQMGENENAKSGKAIAERQRQGDNATYHFIDNQSMMIRHLGRILIDVIPKFYDTKRLLRIRGEDGTMKNIMIDPQAQQAVQQQTDAAARQVNIIFNPSIGEYAVEADVGPSYSTKRQEAWNAITQILTQSPNLIPIIGDLLFQNADFPGADEIAIRLRRMAPPQALQDSPNPQDQALQQQLQQAHDAIVQLQQKLDDKQLDYAIKIDQKNIDQQDADTRRLVAEGNAGPYVTQEQVQPLIMQTLMAMLSEQRVGAGAAQQQAPVPQQMPLPASQGAQPASVQ